MFLYKPKFKIVLFLLGLFNKCIKDFCHSLLNCVDKLRLIFDACLAAASYTKSDGPLICLTTISWLFNIDVFFLIGDLIW